MQNSRQKPLLRYIGALFRNMPVRNHIPMPRVSIDCITAEIPSVLPVRHISTACGIWHIAMHVPAIVADIKAMSSSMILSDYLVSVDYSYSAKAV